VTAARQLSLDALARSSGRARSGASRPWHATTPGQRVLFLMINPSIAGAVKNDPTVRRDIGFAAAWGFDAAPEFGARFSPCGTYRYNLQRVGLEVANIFGLVSTDPSALYENADPVGPGNDAAIIDAVARCSVVVCAWGNGKRAKPPPLLVERARAVVAMLRAAGVQPWCFRLTGAGQPEHPLYQPSKRELIRMSMEGVTP